MHDLDNEKAHPRYFRLLEKGEKLIEGDLYRNNRGEMFKPWIDGHAYDHINNGTGIYLRPVTVDPWIEYAQQKPTKEDFEPTKVISCIVGNQYYDVHRESFMAEHGKTAGTDTPISYWRKVTPPTPAKPKSVEVVLSDNAGYGRQTIVVHADGHVSLLCGSHFSAESIEEFIKAREGVMKQ